MDFDDTLLAVRYCSLLVVLAFGYCLFLGGGHKMGE